MFGVLVNNSHLEERNNVIGMLSWMEGQEDINRRNSYDYFCQFLSRNVLV